MVVRQVPEPESTRPLFTPIAIIVLLVLLAAAAYYIFANRGTNKSTSSNPTPNFINTQPTQSTPSIQSSNSATP